MSVVPLNSTSEISEHLDYLFEQTQGWVYVPVKSGEEWSQYYFEWPRQQSDVIKHIETYAGTADVYIAPALFRKPSGRKDDVKGTHVLWTEFDGRLPDSDALAGLPQPTRRVRSSDENNQHWYWKLDGLLTDVATIERFNRGITYQLEADTSAWDANQVLRPPATINHKQGKPVIIVQRSSDRLATGVFEHINPPPNVVGDIKIDDLPDALNVVAKYPWAPEDWEFFRKTTIPQGSRSSAMMRLAFTCAEMRMTDNEAFSILFNADERWGKFKNRADRKQRLIDLINKARLRHPFEVMPTDDEWPIFGFESFLNTDIHIEWVIPDLLQKAGFLLMSGPPGTGKTQLSLRFAINMALGREFLGYAAGEALPITFFSMEMGHADLKYFIMQMNETLTDEDRKLLQKNLNIIPLGYGVLLDQKKEQQKVEKYIEKHQPAGIFFDSLGSTTTDELSDEATVKKIVDWNDRVRANYDLFTWYIHHNRKAQANNKKPNKLADVYGNQYITARASTVLGMWPNGAELEISCLKLRLTKAFDPFVIERTDGLDFKRLQVGGGLRKRIINIEKTEDDGPKDFFAL